MRPAEADPGELQAETGVRLVRPEALLDLLCAHIEVHCDVQRVDGGAALRTPFGTGHLTLGKDRLLIVARSRDVSGLAYVKLWLAEHILRLSAPQRPRFVWRGDLASVGQPPFFRMMRVVAAQPLTPRMRRLTLEGRDLARFAVGGLHACLLVPQSDHPPQDGDVSARRVYTIRRIDPVAGQIEIDVVLHEGGATPGARFAATATPGDAVGLSGPVGGGIPAARRLFLAGDETALPAIGRILETLDAGAEAQVLVEIADRHERQALTSRGRLSIEWLEREGGTGACLAEAVMAASTALDPDVFLWAAGEFDMARTIRRHLRTDLRRRKGDHLVATYWRRGAAGDAS